nr:hypothetical protein [Tanacetum cinerariifolium]
LNVDAAQRAVGKGLHRVFFGQPLGAEERVAIAHEARRGGIAEGVEVVNGWARDAAAVGGAHAAGIAELILGKAIGQHREVAGRKLRIGGAKIGVDTDWGRRRCAAYRRWLASRCCGRWLSGPAPACFARPGAA